MENLNVVLESLTFIKEVKRKKKFQREKYYIIQIFIEVTLLLFQA